MNGIRGTRGGNKGRGEIFPVEEAQAILEKRLKARGLKEDLAGQGFIRLEIAVSGLDPLSWLAAQGEGLDQAHGFDGAGGVRCYFSGRDDGDGESAGLGWADKAGYEETGDCGAVFKHMESVLAKPGAGDRVRYYGGLAFSGDHIDQHWRSFGGCRFFIPRFEVGVRNNESFLACNLLDKREKQGDNEEMIDETIAQLQQVRFPVPGAFRGRLGVHRLDYHTLPAYEQYVENLLEVLGEIKSGRLEKAVLARAVILDYDNELDGIAILQELKKIGRRRYGFLFQWEKGTMFIGSSPERLYKREGRQVFSEAVAGTRTRGKREEEDDELAEELLGSDKEKREHDYVIWAIERGLRSLCSSLEVERGKKLLKLKEGQHLVTHLQGELKAGVRDEMLIGALHPTPAVGGCPLEKALGVIKRFEPFKRGWYAGVIGTVGKGGVDFAVGLRSALIEGKRVWLYSGGGIVSGSKPGEEWQEANLKIGHFLEILGETAGSIGL